MSWFSNFSQWSAISKLGSFAQGIIPLQLHPNINIMWITAV
jgi:hypothetical protein